MKISKRTLLVVSSVMLSISALGLMFVSADRSLFIDSHNAVQYINKIKFISPENGNDTSATFEKTNNNSVLVNTNNFILGQTGNIKNTIETGVNNSSILGGESNTIKSGSQYSVILGGSGNQLSSQYNTIIGGDNNIINGGTGQTIAGGKNNTIDGGGASVIVGGHDNYLSGNNSVVMGNNSSVEGDYSVALGSGSKIQANNSFLWTDGSSSETLEADDVFAVTAKNGVIINKNTADSFAKLTIGGSLILSSTGSQTGIVCEGGQGGGIITVQKSEEEQLCLCSCDGSGWNSVFGGGRCISVCNQSAGQPECGTGVSRVCSKKGLMYSGSCKVGTPVDGTGAYFIDKNDTIYRSCQTKDGTVKACSISGSNIGGEDPKECEVDPVAYLIPGPEINAKMKSLAEDGALSKIGYFKMYTGNSIPSGVTTETISEETSPNEVVIWYNNNSKTIYYYTEANNIYLNNNSNNMFEGCVNLISIDTLKWDTSKVTDMGRMFQGCISLRKLDVSNWDTTNVTNMHSMFVGCEFTGLDVSNWDTSKVTDMSRMFYYCSSLTKLDVSKWNTSKVTNMTSMFESCFSLTGLDVSNWDTSKVTDMSNMFAGCSSLTSLNLSGRDTSSVTDMSYMFKGCSSLTGLYLSKWNTSNVTKMNYMFYGCLSLIELDVNKWNTSKVTNMTSMFESCSKLEKIYASDNFVTNIVFSSTKMFMNDTKLVGGNGTTYDSSHTNKEYARIDGKNGLPGYFTEKAAYLIPGPEINAKMESLAGNKNRVEYFKMYTGNTIPSEVPTEVISTETSPSKVIIWYKDNTMYYYTNAGKIYLNEDSSDMFLEFYQIISIDTYKWDTSKVTNMKNMISNCPKLTSLDVSNWITSGVVDMGRMFSADMALKNLNVSNWDTSNVENMRYMFFHCQDLTGLDVSKWNTSKVTDMSYMFTSCSSLTKLDVSNWNTKNVTDMSELFAGCSELTELDVSRWDTSSGTNMNATFFYCQNLTNLDLSNWNTKNVTGMDFMFRECSNLKTIYASDKFVTNNVVTSDRMFYKNTHIKGGNGTTYNANHIDKEYAKIDRPGQLGYFTEKVAYLTSGLDINTKMKSLAGNKDNIKYFKMYTGNTVLSGVTTKIISENTSPNEVVIWYDSDSQTIYYYTEAQRIYLNANSSEMFLQCSKIKSIDTYKRDTSRVTNMLNMFYNCSSLTDLNVSSWDTSKVIKMSATFGYCSSLENLDVSNWNTSNVTSMGEMFYKCHNLKSLDVSNWNTSNVTSMTFMFAGCSSLTGLDVSNWNTSNVKNMYNMFTHCSSLTGLDVSNWDTSSGTNMSFMFNYCSSLTKLDLSKWNTSNVTDMGAMFQGCTNLTELDLSNWDTNKVTDMGYMFTHCRKLKTIYVSDKFTTNNIEDSNNMFSETINIKGGNGTTYNPNRIDKDYARIDRPGQPGYFTEKAAYLDRGQIINHYIIELANYPNTRMAQTEGIEHFKKWYEDTMPEGLGEGTIKEISTHDSEYKVRIWYNKDERTIYYYTNAQTIYMNPDGDEMFHGLRYLKDISGLAEFNTSKVETMQSMFYNCKNLTELDVSNWNTSNVSRMDSMFYNCTNLKTIYTSDKFVTSGVTDSSSMFSGATNLVGGNGTTYNSSHTDKEYARIDLGSSRPGYFTQY